MSNARIAVIFYSTYGTNHRVAETAAKAAGEAGAEVRLRRVAETAPEEVVAGQEAWQAQLERMSDIPVASPDDMEWANGYFFSTPTRYGQAASQMRAFIDTLGPLWMEGKLANKTATATSSAQNVHGGTEATILGLYTTFMHWGAVIVPPGYTDPILFETGGNPYGYAATAGNLDEKGEAAVAHQAKRLVGMTEKLAG